MHIPQGASQTIDILSFEEALSLSGHGEDYDSGKWLYVPDFYTEYRYILGTRGEKPLIIIRGFAFCLIAIFVVYVVVSTGGCDKRYCADTPSACASFLDNDRLMVLVREHHHVIALGCLYFGNLSLCISNLESAL